MSSYNFVLHNDNLLNLESWSQLDSAQRMHKDILPSVTLEHYPYLFLKDPPKLSFPNSLLYIKGQQTIVTEICLAAVASESS